MITLEKEHLVFRFPDVHQDAVCSITCQRTLRIPDDGMEYPLPPSLGNFPFRHVDDFTQKLANEHLKKGGVIMPMHQAEAMWISFSSRGEYPFAVKIGTGKINAVTGEPWSEGINGDPQDYVAIPKQPWLDGYHVNESSIRQFVAMPLGEGYSVEEQITGAAEHGGLQISVMPMKADHYKRLLEKRMARERAAPQHAVQYSLSVDSVSMGLSSGGLMRQEIYEDPYGLSAWDQRSASRCFVTIANSNQWMAITGETPPTLPLTASDYSRRGFPWFDYYDADAKAISASKKLGNVKTVSEMGQKLGADPLTENESVYGLKLTLIGRPKTYTSGLVREMPRP